MDIAHINHVYKKATCLYTQPEVEAALDHMANTLAAEVSGKNPLFLCVVTGGVIPVGQLMTRLDFPLQLDYIHVTRYRGATEGGGLDWLAKPHTDLTDRVVVIVDDILDRGWTLEAIVGYCKEQGAKEVLTAVLVDRVHLRETPTLKAADFTGLRVDTDAYLFGYGMDYQNYLRNAPGIFAMATGDEGV